jgi:hypothetical protein
MPLSPFHALYTARELSGLAHKTDRLVPAYASSEIEVYPYQVAAAMFALRSPTLKGVILADEGGLSKSYEALLVITQLWFEGKERILLVVPTPLLGMWWGILQNHFSLPFQIHAKDDADFDFQGVILTTYDYAVENADKIAAVAWDIALFEEAHRLANAESKTTLALKEAVCNAFKLLLTATPLLNSIMDLYGLIEYIDSGVLGDADLFYKRYFRKPENYAELTAVASRYCFRTLRSQVQSYVKIPRRFPVTADYPLSAKEVKLAALVDAYLKKPDKLAFPKMDSYDLSLMFWRAFSSSPYALCKLADGAAAREAEPELVEIAKLAADIAPQSTGKAQALLRALKVTFAELKKKGANRKAIIFTESLATLGFLHNLLSEAYKVLAFNGSKSSDYSVIQKFEAEADILLTTDIAAEGFPLEFCAFVVNYDLPYTVLMMEQRILRSHRTGQNNDVVVLNFLNKQNFADVRMLELINKRVLQFDGIMGMSDDVVGNFTDSAVDGIAAAFAKTRHRKEIEADFAAELSASETPNTAAVQEAESVLFTTFTRDIAEKVTITPQYIKDRTTEINAKLWELTKWFFAGKQGYECIDETRTVRIGIQPEKVFTGARLGRREYSIDDKAIEKSGRHTITGTLAKNILHETFWRGVPGSGTVMVEGAGEPCWIGYYQIKVKTGVFGGQSYFTFVGKTKSGKLLSDSVCRGIMGMPVARFSAQGERYGERDGISKPKPPHELDKLIAPEAFIEQAAKDSDDARLEEIAGIKEAAYRRKQTLGRDIEVLRGELRQMELSLSRVNSVTERVNAEKRKAAASKELKSREQTLFMDSMRLDVQAEEAVKKLVEQGNIAATVKRQFVIEVLRVES